MALIINSKLTTSEGFETSQSLVFVEFLFSKHATMAGLAYYVSKSDFKEGKNNFTPNELPDKFDLKIPKNVFWGDNLIAQIHNYLKTEIEKVTGANTVTIIQDPYS